MKSYDMLIASVLGLALSVSPSGAGDALAAQHHRRAADGGSAPHAAPHAAWNGNDRSHAEAASKPRDWQLAAAVQAPEAGQLGHVAAAAWAGDARHAGRWSWVGEWRAAPGVAAHPQAAHAGRHDARIHAWHHA